MFRTLTPIPNQIRPSIETYWYDLQNDNSFQSNKDFVSVIFTKNGKNSFRQPVTKNQPKITNINGMRCLSFDGINSTMLSDQNTIVSEPFTIFVVGKYNDATNRMSLIGRQTGNIPGQFVIRKESNSQIFNSFLFGSDRVASSRSILGNLNFNIHCVSFKNNSSLNYAINNQNFGKGAVINGYNNSNNTRLVLGSSNEFGLDCLNGLIGEIIIYRDLLNITEINIVREYLTKKWRNCLI